MKKGGNDVGDRIALIIESSHRPNQAMPAYQFYRGPYSNWIKSVIQYLGVREFDKDNIFFLSYHGHRVIPYEGEVQPYPKRKDKVVSKKESETFAKKILTFVKTLKKNPFVEIHAGKDIGVPLTKLFRKHGVASRVYADGVPLGQKPSYYKQLMYEHEKMQELRVKANNPEKFSLLTIFRGRTIYEAKVIAEKLQGKATSLGIDEEYSYLEYLLSKYHDKQKAVYKEKDRFEKLFKKAGEPEELAEFIKDVDIEADLYVDASKYKILKQKYRQALSKFGTILVKMDMVREQEEKISHHLKSMQVALRRIVLNSM